MTERWDPQLTDLDAIGVAVVDGPVVVGVTDTITIRPQAKPQQVQDAIDDAF